MSPFQQLPGPADDFSDEDYDRLVRVYKEGLSNASAKKQTTRYFLMDGAYEWKEVSREDYINVPPDMINNKACVDRDGLVTISVANIMQCSLEALAYVLMDGFNDTVIARG